MRILVILACSLGLSACAMFDLDNVTYTSTMDGPGIQQWYAEKEQAKFYDAKNELGLGGVRELTNEEVKTVYQRMQLKYLESKLEYKAEKEQYYALKPHFRNDQERIEFLSQPNHMARQRWSQFRGIASLTSSFTPQENKLIESNDIGKGMSMEAVRQSWGEPEMKQAAGNSLYRHQAWHYRKLVSTENGYHEERRVIFFESGRVAGWQTF